MKDAVLASGHDFKIFYDLTAAPLTLEIGKPAYNYVTSHSVYVSTRNNDNYVMMEAMFKGSREYEMKISFDGGSVKLTTTMVYTYPEEVSLKATQDNWFVTYAFEEYGKLEVYMSSDYEGLRAEDSKLQTNDIFPIEAWMFMEEIKTSLNGISLTLQMGAEYAADSKITFHYRKLI